MGKAVTLSELVVKLTLDSQAAMNKLDAFNKKIASSMNQQAGASRRVNNNLQRSASSASNLNNAGLNALDTYSKLSMKIFGIYQTLDLAKKVVNVGFEVEGMNAGLTAILGADPKNAGQDIGAMVKGQFDFAKKVANENGKDLLLSMDSWMRLSASAAGKVPQKDLEDIFRGVSDYGTVLGVSTDRMRNSYLAIQQMLSKGVVQSEEMKRQLAEHMPGALQVFARSIGKTDTQVIEMMKSGELIASEVLPKMGRELSRTANAAGGLTKKQQGARAATMRLVNTFEEMSIALYEGGLGEGLITITTGLVEFLATTKKLVPWLGNFAKNFSLAFVSAFKVAGYFVTRFLDIITGGSLKGNLLDYLLEKFEDLTGMKKGTATIDNLILTLEDLFIAFLLFKIFKVITIMVQGLWWLIKTTKIARAIIWTFNIAVRALAFSAFLLNIPFLTFIGIILLVVSAIGLLYYAFSGKLYDFLAETFPELMDFLGESIAGVIDWFGKLWKSITDPIADSFTFIESKINQLLNLRNKFKEGFWGGVSSAIGINNPFPQKQYMNDYVSKGSGNTSAQSQQNNEINFNITGNLDKATGDRLVKEIPIMLDYHAP